MGGERKLGFGQTNIYQNQKFESTGGARGSLLSHSSRVFMSTAVFTACVSHHTLCVLNTN